MLLIRSKHKFRKRIKRQPIKNVHEKLSLEKRKIRIEQKIFLKNFEIDD